jgi:hypothetical protein
MLCGCESPEVRQTIAGLNAFRTGDEAALNAAQAGLARIDLGSNAATQPTHCSPEDFNHRRAKAFSDLLSFLNSQSDNPESENVRFFRLQSTFGVVLTDDIPPLGCPPSAYHDRSLDRRSRLEVAVAERQLLAPWAVSLGHLNPKLGPNLEFEGVETPQDQSNP